MPASDTTVPFAAWVKRAKRNAVSSAPFMFVVRIASPRQASIRRGR
jgi:hypothetical protein